MTRDEYIAGCKKRALEYVDRGDLVSAGASMICDMNKREDCQVNPVLLQLGMCYIVDLDAAAMRRWIEGFR